jgi:hypothetical protein
LWLAFPGREQKQTPAMVRHGHVWQPGKGKKVLPSAFKNIEDTIFTIS